MQRGLTKAELLVIIAMAFVGLLTLGFFFRRAVGKDGEQTAIEQMRRVYVGFAMYQEDNQSRPPGSLGELIPNVDVRDLASASDPFVGTAKSYPLEPTLPDLKETTSNRISYAYVGNFIRTGRAPFHSWADASNSLGVIAEPWIGSSSDDSRPFAAYANGPILRILIDGTLQRVAHRDHPERMGDFADLFTKR